jgi:hypothetical protein
MNFPQAADMKMREREILSQYITFNMVWHRMRRASKGAATTPFIYRLKSGPSAIFNTLRLPWCYDNC